ncbi:MAG: hypothetical protein V1734_04885 [Nanoarchaeota archaeon]
MINGTKYDFKIHSADGRFFIKAICKKSGRFSCITNMNLILSNLGVAGKRYYDTPWNLPVKECKLLAKSANELFSEEFKSNIEAACEEDRTCGEWENKL